MTKKMFDLRRTCRRTFPKVSYCNLRKRFPNSSAECWKQWFAFDRLWAGRVWNFNFRHHQVSLDFRVSWLDDMLFPNTTEKDRKAVNDALEVMEDE